MGVGKKAREILAENVKGLRDKPGAPAALGVAPKTINNIERARHNIQLDTLDAIARKLKVEPYHLLVPSDDQKFLDVILAWAQSDERGRGDLHAIAEALLRRSAERDEGNGTATTVARRDRAG